MSIRINKFTVELEAAGIPINGVSCVGTQSGTMNDPICDDATINYLDGATPAQIAQGAAIKAAHDSSLPLGYVNALTTGPKLIGVVGNASQVFFPIYYRLFVRNAVNLTGAPTITMGSNSPNFDNLQTSLAMTVANGWASGKYRNFTFGYSAVASYITAPTYIYVNVTVAAVGSGGAQAVIGGQFFGDYLTL